MNQTQVRFTQLVSDLIEMKINGMEEINNRLSLLKLHLKSYYMVFLLCPQDPDNPALPLSKMTGEMERRFPAGCSCVYREMLVLFLPLEGRLPPDLDEKGLEGLLAEWKVFLGTGGPARHLEQFRSFFLMAEAAVRLGRKLGRPGQRIFYFEDYRMYYLADLCRQGFVESHHHDNLIYLCHPDIITLYRYDMEHRTEYRTILYEYLLYDCNLTQTARKLNYHRNTMQYKLYKIEEIIGRPLADGSYKQTLLFSCAIARYITEYLGRDLQYREPG